MLTGRFWKGNLKDRDLLEDVIVDCKLVAKHTLRNWGLMEGSGDQLAGDGVHCRPVAKVVVSC